MDFVRDLGFIPTGSNIDPNTERERLFQYINLKLLANGLPPLESADIANFSNLSLGLLENYKEKTRRLSDERCPADERIETFLNRHFADVTGGDPLRLPGKSLILDRHGIARQLSIPADGEEFVSDWVRSYRAANGVLHNPKHDRRTTQGTFHIVEGGLPIPADKKEVPRKTFVELFRRAVEPPQHLRLLPITANQEQQAFTFVSLLLRPIVCPEVPGYCQQKTFECRFFAPGTLVSNLDFVESIFGNAGDPVIPQNDAGLDIQHWTGHSGAVLLAPHLIHVTKKEVGLPRFEDATDRQRKEGMCWDDASELYNDGQAFKVTCRNEEGVIVTLIADNYFGYCKKEVKTQISYSANLFGLAEEEHAGGTLVFPSFNLGEEYQVQSRRFNNRTFADVKREYGSCMELKPEGYGVDLRYPNLIYIPGDAQANLRTQDLSWKWGDQRQRIPLLPGHIYMAPSGYRIRMEKHPSAPSWRLIGTSGEGIVAHKPCTVSGGGKSEISKSLVDYMLYGPVFVSDFEKDMEIVEEIFNKDYTNRWNEVMQDRQHYDRFPSRSILSQKRSLGSVIKLLTPSDDYNDEYNAWIRDIPNHIYALAFAIKRLYQPDWGDDWRSRFSVDTVNGSPGHELKLNERKIVGTYLRVGLTETNAWRTYKVRQDFAAGAKVQTEDDITASVVVPSRFLNHLTPLDNRNPAAHKFSVNCEYRLFQRPDEAIHRGFDKQTELDLSQPANFISNFEPLTQEQVDAMTRYIVDFDAFSAPMQALLRSMKGSEFEYVVCSANPRQVEGGPTKNPRYLQNRPDLVTPMDRYVAEMGTRLFRGLPAEKPLHLPVNAVLSGRRNNPPDRERGIRSLAVYNPIHYQELPELFMDYICSLTGKSPSTTGAGSEGALTKGPFNALRPAADLNAALISMMLTGLDGYSTAAGHIGPDRRVDHDLSLLIPEVWCRMTPDERDPRYLIERELLEPIEDFEHKGQTILGSRLGYRITYDFVREFFGRVFDNPDKVFDEAMLKPETQDLDSYADGIRYITDAQQRVARMYLDDGTVDACIPPLQTLLHIMAEGSWNGQTEKDPEVRAMFTLETLQRSDWYTERLLVKQSRDIAAWQRSIAYLDRFLLDESYIDVAEEMDIAGRKQRAEKRLKHVKSSDYLEELQGTLGAQPFTS